MLLTDSQTIEHRHLDTLLKVSRAIGTIRNTDELMRQIMTQTTAAFAADRSTLFVHDAERGQLWSRVAQGLEHWSTELRICDDAGIAGHVFQTRLPLLIPDTFEHPLFARDLAEQTGYVPRSMIVVPVSHRPDRCDGILEVMDHRPAAFHEDDRALLEAIAVQVSITLDNARLYQAQERQFHSFVAAFSAALDARDPITQAHSINVANYAMGIAAHLGLDRTRQQWFRVAGLLHDVGKIGTPEAVLTKPGKLDPHEFEQMKQHATHTHRILSRIEFTDAYRHMAAFAAAHHEKLDGSGYPDGLAGDGLPLEARVLCVADIFDALTQTRHYRAGMSVPDALAIIDRMTPHQLDAACVAALKKYLGVEPR